MQQLPSHMLPEVFTPDALNVEITPAGRLRLPRLGAERFRSAAVAGARIDGLWELRRADGTWIYVLACAGSLYTMDASTTLATLGALTDTKRRWSAVTYGGRLLIFNGSDMPQSFKTELERLRDVEDASLPVGWEAGNWPARVALLGAGEVEQLACWGLARERSSVYFSEVKNPLVWNSLQSSTAGRVIVREEDGEEVVAVVDFAGLTLVMKETVTVGYFDLDPHAGTAAGMKVYPWGCASADSLIRYENGLAWWARWKGGHGPLTLSAVQDYADIAAEAMTWRIQPALNEVSPSHLALISGYVQLLLAEAPAGSESQERLRTVHEQIGRLASIVRDLMNQTRTPLLKRVPTDAAAILTGIARLARPSAEQKGVVLEVDAGLAPLPLLADAGQMEQVFLNLVTNALDAMGRGGHLTLRAQKDGTHIRFEVEDTGSGIPPEVRPRIFEPLFTTKEPGRGTGLGLPIVRDIVTAHQGTVEVYSEAGRGARFVVLLPGGLTETSAGT